MSNRTRILVSAILIMAGGMFCAAAVTSAILYKLEFDEQRDHLMEIARGQARFMEAVARFDATHSQDDHPGGARAATLSQIAAAHEHYPGFGETGELVVAQREGDQIVFLFPYRHGDGGAPDPIPWASELAEPMRQALSGQEGTLIGLDYRGERVLAAYHTVAVLNLGVVAKADLVEIRAPFVMAALVAGGATVLLVLVGTGLTLRVTDPMVRELQESEARFRLAITEAPFPIMIHAEGGDVIRINKIWTELTGYAPEEIPTLSEWTERAYGQRHEVVRSRIDKLFERNTKVEEGEYSITTRRGDALIWDFSSAPLGKLPDGRRLVISMAKDVTDRKRAEEERRRLATAIDQAVEAIVITDLEGTAQYVNPAFERTTGYTRQETVGKNMRLINSGKQDRAFYQDLWGTIKRGEVWTGQFINKRKDGALYDEEGTISSVRDESGKIINFVAVKHDVTERKRAEEAFRNVQERLREHQQREKEQVQTELEKVRDELVTRTRLATIGQVSASIGHELRNPLGSIRNAAFLLKRRVPKGMAKWAEYLDIISEEVNRADNTISNLMEMCRPKQSGKEEVDLGRTVKEASVRANVPKNVRFRVALEPDPFLFRGDPGQLRQVLGNLFTNAVQAMNGGGEIGVDARHRDDYDEIIVRDRGPGIPAEDRERLFEPLFSTKAMGTGLGLTICRQIIEHHGGTIELIEAESGGAAFEIRLPAQHTQESFRSEEALCQQGKRSKQERRF